MRDEKSKYFILIAFELLGDSGRQCGENFMTKSPKFSFHDVISAKKVRHNKSQIFCEVHKVVGHKTDSADLCGEKQ